MTTLTMKEEKRLEIIQRVFRGELTVVEAGVVIGVSERQCYRIKARVTKRGAKGVVHGNRGRACKRKTKEKEVMDCAPSAGEFSPRFEGSATGSFGFLNLHLVFLRG